MKKIPGSDNLSMGASGEIYGCPSKCLLMVSCKTHINKYKNLQMELL